MQITVHLDTAAEGELNALAALIAALGGAPTVVSVQPTITVVEDRTPVAPTPPAVRPAPPAPETPRDAAEVLLQQEAARVSAAAPPPPPAEPPAAGAPQLDKEGIPYDARIHSGTPTMNADGTWRKKRGIDEVEYGRIHAELQQQYAGQAAGNLGTGTTNAPPAPNGSATVATPPAPPPPASPDPTASVPAAPPPPADVPNAPAPPSANTAPPAAESAPAAGSFGDFAAFVQAVSAIRNPQIPYKELNDTANSLGVAAFKDMKDRPDLWATFYGMSGGQ